jgi:SHS family lactate transporter-like MFS transporter
MPADAGSRAGPRLYGWRDPALLAVAAVVAAAGFGQFGAVAALGDVAAEFGEVADGDEVAQQVGLSATAIGVGLGAIRLASLGSLPLAGLADRFGRRALLLAWCAVGLVLTMGAAASPSYWWFVAIFALSRPFLTATDALGAVVAAEQTASVDRSKAVALIAAAFGIGSGLIAVARGVGADLLGFRGVFLLAALPLVLLVVIRRWLEEPDRYRSVSNAPDRPVPVLGAVARRHRGRLGVVVAVTFGVSLVTGPANSYLFVYGENVLDLSPAVTSAMVVAAGPVGLLGLLLGRWGADVVGRRGTATLALVGVAAAFTVTYSGSAPALIGGYLLAVTAGSTFAPAIGSLVAELFPTDVRATVTGWTVAGGVAGAVAGLVAFGALSDAFDAFAPAAIAIAVPAALIGAVVFAVPETVGRELEDLEAEGAFGS